MAAISDTNKLNHYLAAWKLSNPQLLTQTMTSHIYTVTHRAETVPGFTIDRVLDTPLATHLRYVRA